MTLSPEDIDVRLARLDAEILEAEDKAVRLALPAVSGDAAAVERLAEVEAYIAQLKADRETLSRARAGALSIAQAEAARLAAQMKATHFAKARKLAPEMVTLAADLDAALVAAREASAAIVEKWAAIQRELRAAKQPAPGGNGWQSNVGGSIAAHVQATFDDAPFRRPTTTVYAHLLHAWSFLLIEETADV